MEKTTLKIYTVNNWTIQACPEEIKEVSESLLANNDFIIEQYDSPYKNTRSVCFAAHFQDSTEKTIKRNNWILDQISSESTWFEPKHLYFHITDPLGNKYREEKRFSDFNLNSILQIFKMMSNFDSLNDYNTFHAELLKNRELIEKLEKENNELKNELNELTANK